VIRFNDEQYWLYAAVDPESNKSLHTQLEPTTNSVLAQQFLAELGEKRDVDGALFLIDGSHSLKDACSRRVLDLRVERHGDRNTVERILQEIKRGTSSCQTVLTTPMQKLLMSGCKDSRSHGISVSERDGLVSCMHW
jgi:transposase-like protein